MNCIEAVGKMKNAITKARNKYLFLAFLLALKYFKVVYFLIFFSNDNSSEGNSSKLETIANKRVTETKPPNAIVPPKLEMVNTKNPKNNTIEV